MSLLLATLHQVADAHASKASATPKESDTPKKPKSAELDASRYEQRVLVNKGTTHAPLRYLDTAWARTIRLDAKEVRDGNCLVPLNSDRFLIVEPNAPVQILGYQDDLTLIYATGELDIHENTQGEYDVVAYRSAKPGEEPEIVTLPEPPIKHPVTMAQRSANRIQRALQILGPYLDTASALEPYRGDLVVELQRGTVLPREVRYQLYALDVWNQSAPHIWSI